MLLALAPNVVLAATGLAITALAGPIVFITIVTMVQREIDPSDIGKILDFGKSLSTQLP